MPLYEYKCSQCGELIEKLRPIPSRDDSVECEKCGAAVQRILSAFNTLAKSNQRNSSACPEAVECENPDKSTGGAAIRLGGGNVTVKGCTFKNLRTGVSMAKGTKVDMHDNKFEKVTSLVEVTDD